ncbi:SDR family NAD(P)-dependent oxidoreductase [Catenulispora rubra]|uniref:SDR family NAD(P)-dependent oxidoreductase n=1 Tax=Catenulispora rubra TaxID=280293 RepID=UPI001891F4F3|nr:SDR family oxidoreductase [Catenulispora rubra]
MANTIVIGGTGGLGQVIAQRLADRGDDLVITSRDLARAEEAAGNIKGAARGLAVDLSEPASIVEALADVEEVDNLVIAGIEQTPNTLASFDVEAAVRVVTIKLVGYAEVVRALRPRFRPGASVVLFGGVAKDKPYPGSTMVTVINQGVSGLAKTLAIEIAPHRVNAIHPAVVGDSPKWRDFKDHPAVPRTPIGRLVTMDEVAGAVEFLLTNTGINGQDLVIDGGVQLT